MDSPTEHTEMAHPLLPGYMAIDEDNILGRDRSIRFDIFIRQEINGQPKPMLLRCSME